MNFLKNLDLLLSKSLPKDFSDWLMVDSEGNPFALIAAKKGLLPKNWTQNPKDWLITNHKKNSKDTIAHTAALKGILPPDWTDKTDDWLVKNERGYTIAHIASYRGETPSNWTNDPRDWLVKDMNGNTIAHLAANKNSLPYHWTQDISNWMIKNNNEQSIGLIYSKLNHNHYNNPNALEDYLININDHLIPFLDNNKEKNNYDKLIIVEFMNPFIQKIKNSNDYYFTLTSELFSGYVIDQIEYYLDKCFLVFEKKDTSNLVDPLTLDKINEFKDEIEKTIDIIKNQKIKIKEELFSYKKNNLNENQIDLSSTI